MGYHRRGRRIALYAGGGVGGLLLTGLLGLAGVMRAEVKLAERRIPLAKDDPPPSNDTTWAAVGVSRSRPPIRLAMLGDSTSAGYGVYRDRDTPGARLAIGDEAFGDQLGNVFGHGRPSRGCAAWLGSRRMAGAGRCVQTAW